MKRTILGICLAQVIIYLWGFLVWGLGPYRTLIWKQPVDDAAAGAALREQFPSNGMYAVPSFNQDEATVAEMFAKGPVAFVHMVAVNGRPLMDPSILAGGFVLNLAVIVLIVLLLTRAAPALPGYVDRVRFVALAGLSAILLIDGGDVVWWQLAWNWKLYMAGYHFSFWLISGLILAKFVTASPPQPV